MIKHRILWIALGFLHLELATGQISCYQCNVDSSSRFTQDCTDPYVPTPLNHLFPCPEDEPHHCVTAVILYNHNDVTVRGCIPSRLRDTYCEDSNFHGFPGARINCTFCDIDACNHSNIQAEPICNLILGLVALVAMDVRDIIFGW